MYQPELGRFSTVDPHADSYAPWTPYNYVADNPVLLIDPDGKDWVINKSNKDDKEHYDITFIAAIVNESETTTAEDLISLAYNLSTQIQDALRIDEDGVSTSVNVQINISKDGEVKDNEHSIRVVDDMPSDEVGDADIGGRDIRLNSSHLWSINGGGKEQNLTVGPHEAGHTGGLHHPDAQWDWTNPSTWSYENWQTPKDQYLSKGQDNDNLMFSGPFRQNALKQDLNNDRKGYRINANQARILYQN